MLVLRSDWSSSLNLRYPWLIDSSKDKVLHFPASIIALIDWFAYRPWLSFFDNHTKTAPKRVWKARRYTFWGSRSPVGDQSKKFSRQRRIFGHIGDQLVGRNFRPWWSTHLCLSPFCKTCRGNGRFYQCQSKDFICPIRHLKKEDPILALLRYDSDDTAEIHFVAVRSPQVWVSRYCTKWRMQGSFVSSFSRSLNIKT